MENEIFYTGMGPRDAPAGAIVSMEEIGQELARRGYTLRSGGSDGADLAFERGCNSVNGKKEIYLPWENFNENRSLLFNLSKEALDSVKEFHPAPERLNKWSRLLHARNYQQLVGLDGILSKFVVTWFPKFNTKKGGTFHTIKIAKHFNIPIINIMYYSKEEIFDIIDNILNGETTKEEWFAPI